MGSSGFFIIGLFFISYTHTSLKYDWLITVNKQVTKHLKLSLDFGVKEKKKNKDDNKIQNLLDNINVDPFAYFLKPLENVADFPNKVVSGLEKLLESPFHDNNKPWSKIII